MFADAVYREEVWFAQQWEEEGAAACVSDPAAPTHTYLPGVQAQTQPGRASHTGC